MDKNKEDYKEYENETKQKIIILTRNNNELLEKITQYENYMKDIKKKEANYEEKIDILEIKVDHLNKVINEKDIYINNLKDEITKLKEINDIQMLGPAKTTFDPEI